MTTTPTAYSELFDLDRLEALARAATPGPWETETVRSEGEYGTDEDGGHGFDAYAIVDGKGRPMMDSLNRDDSSIHTEWTGDAFYAWDELAKRDAHFIAAANPAAVLALIALARRAQPEGEAPQAERPQPELTVWEGPMPESNGRQNYTAVLHRKESTGIDLFTDGFQFARSEYPDRTRYEADFMRWLIGERDVKPELWDDCYDMDKHSGYAAPAAQHAESGAQASSLTTVPCPCVAANRTPVCDDCDGQGRLIVDKHDLADHLAAQSQGAQATPDFEDYWNRVGQYGREGRGGEWEKSFAKDAWHSALAAKAEAPAPRTELSKRIREAATADVTEKQARLLIGAAEEIERAQQAAAPGALAELGALRRLIECAEILNKRPRPMCRDCGDEDGTCPNSGLECDMRTLLAKNKALYNRLAAPSAPGTPEAPSTVDDVERLMIEHRIAVTPEYEGGFVAAIYRDEDQMIFSGYAPTPRTAIDAAIEGEKRAAELDTAPKGGA